MQIFSHALDLLSGELRDPSGHILTAATRPVVAVHDRAQARAAFGKGSRAAIAVPLTANGTSSRVLALCLARVRINSAKRQLASAGASRVRAFAIVSSTDGLLLAYELNELSQPYIEDNVILSLSGSTAGRLLRRGFRMLSGVPTTVDVVAVVGERP